MILLCICALLFNLILAYILGDILHIPLFMDTIGTVAVVFYAGLFPGLIVAGLYNVLRFGLMVLIGNPAYPWEMMYALCGIAIAFSTWILSWRNKNIGRGKSLTSLYLVLIAIVSSFASSFTGGAIETFQRQIFDNQIYPNPVKDFVTAFLGDKFGLFVACVIARIPFTTIDRLICTFAGYLLYKGIKKLAVKFETGSNHNEFS